MHRMKGLLKTWMAGTEVGGRPAGVRSGAYLHDVIPARLCQWHRCGNYLPIARSFFLLVQSLVSFACNLGSANPGCSKPTVVTPGSFQWLDRET